MLTDMTRSRLIQIWFTAVALVTVAAFALGASLSMGTGAMLLVLCFVPPAIVLKLWPGTQPQTAAEVIRGTERR
jgi:hypothetical protein